MLDFGALPPEVNSTRMYAGPGSAPLVSAASAWQATATTLESVARSYDSVICELQGHTWSGNASTAMADAAQPYVAWLAAAATNAEQTAGAARAAVASYESAYSATVPPALVTANRAHYTALVAANIVGQYTTEIAAAEAEYAQMWAQDAAAMYTYAASSSAASAVTPFGEPPQTTTITGKSAQADAVAQAASSSSASNTQSSLSQLLAAVPQQLQSLAGGGASTSAALGPSPSALIDAFYDFNQLIFPGIAGAAFTRTFFSGGSYSLAAARTSIQNKDLPKMTEGDTGEGSAKTASSAADGRAAVVAETGRAEPIGALSAPPRWAAATPVASAVEEPQWMSDADLAAVPVSADTAGTATVGAGPMMGMSPAGSPYARSTVNHVLRVPSRGFKMPRPTLGG